MYGGVSYGANITNLVSQLTENPALLLGQGRTALFGGSVSIFTIFGNEEFKNASSYTGPFKSVSATIAGKKGYAHGVVLVLP